MSKAMKEKLQKEMEERRVRDEAARLLDILLHRKSRSIAGSKVFEKSKFNVNDARTGLPDDEQDQYNTKLISYMSHKNLTYFRPKDWIEDKISAGDGKISEEQMK